MNDPIKRLNTNSTDTIYCNDAIDALAYFDERSPTGKTAQDIIIGLPSAQPKIPEASSQNTNLYEPLMTAGYIQGWNDCREYVLRGGKNE